MSLWFYRNDIMLYWMSLWFYRNDITLYWMSLSFYRNDITLYWMSLWFYRNDIMLYWMSLSFYRNDIMLYWMSLSFYRNDIMSYWMSLWFYVLVRLTIATWPCCGCRHGSLQQWRISMHPFWRVCGKNLNIVSMCAVSPMVYTSDISSCQKKLFSFPATMNSSIKVGPLVFLL
jgi:hypothetical protein